MADTMTLYLDKGEIQELIKMLLDKASMADYYKHKYEVFEATSKALYKLCEQFEIPKELTDSIKGEEIPF